MEKILGALGIHDITAGMKNIRTLTLTALLIALTIIGNRVIAIPTPFGFEVRFGFIFLATIAFLFGPVAGFSAGFLTNMIGFLMLPRGGAFNPLFDLNVGLMGLFYALFLYKRNPKSPYFIIRIVAAQAAVNIICRIVINTYLLILIGWIPREGAVIFTTVRLFRNIVFIPLEIILLLMVLKFVAEYARKYNFLETGGLKS